MAGIVYPLDYGISDSGSVTVDNRGSIAAPVVATFYGPLNNPVAVAAGDSDWSLGFDLNLADGERLTVDTAAGTVLLNGTADRLYTIRTDADPLERCLLAPGETTLSLTATSGTGRLVASFRDARM